MLDQDRELLGIVGRFERACVNEHGAAFFADAPYSGSRMLTRDERLDDFGSVLLELMPVTAHPLPSTYATSPAGPYVRLRQRP